MALGRVQLKSNQLIKELLGRQKVLLPQRQYQYPSVLWLLKMEIIFQQVQVKLFTAQIKV